MSTASFASQLARYGNWGGEDWSGGLRPSENGNVDGDAGPIDSSDWLYMLHDKDYLDIDEGLYDGTPAEISWKKSILRKEADKKLADGLRDLPENPRDWLIPPPDPGMYAEANAFRWSAIAMFDQYREVGSFFQVEAVSRMLSDLYIPAQYVGTYFSPIILDLNGDGTKTTSNGLNTYFDHQANGFAEQTGWADPNDGLLVLDRDGDGIITSGHELFGNNTQLQNGTNASQGFQALAEYDTNLDGKITFADDIWSSLKVWQDVDSDGLSLSDELKTLDELGIQALNLAHTTPNTTDANGNVNIAQGTFILANGSTREMSDFNFETNTMISVALDTIELPSDIAAMPYVSGYGLLPDLQQAMAHDASGTLKTLVDSYIAATNTNDKTFLIDQIIKQWAGTDGIDPASRGQYIDARQLEALEKFMGREYTLIDSSNPNNPTPDPGDIGADYLRDSYWTLANHFSAQLDAQTSLKPLLDLVTWDWDLGTNALQGNLTLLISQIQSLAANDPQAAETQVFEVTRTLNGLGIVEKTNFADFQAAFEGMGDLADYGFASVGKGIIPLTTGDDTLRYRHGDSVLDTGAGNDIITGDAANVIINLGSGNDSYTGEGNNLTVYGMDGDDTITGATGNDRLLGGAGADILHGSYGNDTLFGGDGNDKLYGEVGVNSLHGGAGADELYGGGGKTAM